MSKEFKVYKYYYKADMDDIMHFDVSDKKRTILDKYPLYAITNVKEYAKEFEFERNMDAFIKRVDKMDVDEYREFIEYMNAEGAILDRYTLTTRKHPGKCAKEEIDMMMTENEKIQVLEEQSYYDLEDPRFWNIIDPRKFNKKLRKALNILQYTAFYKLMSPSFIPGPEDEDVPAPEVVHDEFYMLTRLFSGTF